MLRAALAEDPVAAAGLQEPGRHSLPQRPLRRGGRSVRARRQAQPGAGRRSLLQARQHRLQEAGSCPRPRELGPGHVTQPGASARAGQPRNAGPGAMIPADDAAFAALTRKISREAGLSLDAYKDKCLRRRIAVRMRACGVHTFADYQAVLDRTPGEYERLKDAITINVTRFYRNAETWNLLRGGLLPEVCERGDGDVRAWSAGCSSGEEPYTLAHPDGGSSSTGRAGRTGSDRVTVDATDIDRQCLERAEAGRYRREALVEVPAGSGGPLLRGRRQWLPGDRPGAPPGGVPRARPEPGSPRCAANYQLILCRNVVIYFERATQERVFLSFADALAPGRHPGAGKGRDACSGPPESGSPCWIRGSGSTGGPRDPRARRAGGRSPQRAGGRHAASRWAWGVVSPSCSMIPKPRSGAWRTFFCPRPR